MTKKDLEKKREGDRRIVIECPSNMFDGFSYFYDYDPENVSIAKLRRIFTDALIFWADTGYTDLDGNALFYNLEDVDETKFISEFSIIW